MLERLHGIVGRVNIGLCAVLKLADDAGDLLNINKTNIGFCGKQVFLYRLKCEYEETAFQFECECDGYYQLGKKKGFCITNI